MRLFRTLNQNNQDPRHCKWKRSKSREMERSFLSHVRPKQLRRLYLLYVQAPIAYKKRTAYIDVRPSRRSVMEQKSLEVTWLNFMHCC